MNGSRPDNQNDAGGPIPLPSVMPPELVGTSRLLDALGACDRASAPAGLEGRLLTSLRAGVLPAGGAQSADVADAAQRMEQLAQADLAAASRTLEDRIFMATRGVLASNAVKAEVQVRVKRRGLFASGGFAFRAAAGLLLGGGVIWGYQALKPAGPSPNLFESQELAVKALEKKIDGQMDQLGEIFALARIDSVWESQGTGSEDVSDSSESWSPWDLLEGGES